LESYRVRKGQWFTGCCEEDLEQAAQDMEVVPYAGEPIRVWESREAAIEELRKEQQPKPLTEKERAAHRKLAEFVESLPKFEGFH